nr:PfkB family carbohydrate kinase [Chloroflexota bacterium]
FDDLAILSGLDAPEAMVEHCLRLGARIVALKHGAQGAWLAEGKRRIRIAPHPCRPVDATGAGDAYAAGLISRLSERAWPPNEAPLRDAMRAAAALAALVAGAFGAQARVAGEGAPVFPT